MKVSVWIFWLCLPLLGLGQYQVQRAAFPTAVGTTGSTDVRVLVQGGKYGRHIQQQDTVVRSGLLFSHRYLGIVAPQGGDVWQPLTTHTIRWYTLGSVPTVTLWFSSDGGVQWQSIAENVGNRGEYAWMPTTTTAAARVRVEDASASAVRAESAVFAILPWQVRLLTPSDFAVLFAGQGTTLSWSVVGSVDTLRLEYRRTPWHSWSTIATVTAATTGWVWVVPDEPTTQAVVRIYAVADPSLQDSARFVEIRSTTQTAINVALYLEGAYDSSSGTMRRYLDQSGYVPDQQPYGGMGYTGTEQRAAWVTDVVDWVLIELRATNGTTVIGQTAGLLRSDGQVIDESGYPQVLTANVGAGEYFVVVRHRNHIAVMSSSATVVAVGYTADRWDFRQGEDWAYRQFAAGQKQAGSAGMLVAGDIDQDGIINARDRAQSRNALFGIGYVSSDVNLDGTVNATDRTIIRDNTFWVIQVP